MRDIIWKVCIERLTEDNVKKKRKDARKRLKRKRDVKRSTEKVVIVTISGAGV